jgi:hypothetical protein
MEYSYMWLVVVLEKSKLRRNLKKVKSSFFQGRTGLMKTATDEAASALLSMQTMFTPPSSPKISARLEGSPPTKFSLTRVKRKNTSVIELVYMGDDSVTEIVVPVHPGDTKETVSKRQKMYALLEQERGVRMTAYCVWKKSFVSFRYDPAQWKTLVVAEGVERHIYEYIQLVLIKKKTCKYTSNNPQCDGCAGGERCEYEEVYRYLLPLPKVNGKHGLCDSALSDFMPIGVDKDDDDREYQKHMPTCAVRS